MSEAFPADAVSPAPQGAPPDRLSAAQLFAYSAPAIGLHFTLMLMGLYFFKFATDVLLVGPALLGLLVGGARLWDAVSDPIAGYLSDRTRTRFGRRRPWMAAGSLPFGISMLMLWSPPAGLAGAWMATWVGAGLFLFYTAYTAVMVPYGALGAELSQDYHDRTRLFAWRYGVGAAGMLLGVGAFYLLLESGDPGTAVLGLGPRAIGSLVAVASLVLTCASVAVLVVRVHERPDYLDRGPERMFGAFADVARNLHARQLLGVQLLHFFSTVALSIVAAFMFEHVMRVPSWVTAVLVAAFALGTVCAIPLWVRVSSRFGKARSWRAALWTVGVIYLSVFFGMRDGLDTGVLAVAIAASASLVLGAAQSSSFVLAHSMQADVIDWDEYVTGERKEGAYLASLSFVEKAAGALAAVLIGVALELVGYRPGEPEQDAATRYTILGLMTILPAVCHFAGALLLRGYSLDEALHARIRRELDAARAGAGALP